VPAGDLTPVHRLVAAFPQPGQQGGVERGLPGGDRVPGRTVSVVEDLADVFGPALPVRAQGLHSLEVAR
jgi:hypothetical protein